MSECLKFLGSSVTDDDVAKACEGAAAAAVKCVELRGCSRVTDISPLAEISTLREVHVQSCGSVRYLGLLAQRAGTALRKIVFDGTPVTGAQRRDMLLGNDVEVLIKGDGEVLNLERPPQSVVKASIDMIRDVAGRFSPEEIGVAFNGGKDSVVMMDLLQCALDRETLGRFCLFTLGNGGGEELSEIVSFRDTYVAKNGLSLLRVDPSFSMKDGLAYVKETRGIRLVFLGTRSSDSAHQKEAVESTTAGWPEMLRASPVFHWQYDDIWGYTRAYKLPFCSLYSQGYTSVGVSATTRANPLLRRDDGTFRPAWELGDVSEERKGRCG